MNHHKEQLTELIKRELGAIIERELDIKPGTIVTITEVHLDKELENASVLVSIYPERETTEIMKNLTSEIADYERLLKKRIKLGRLPKITFKNDLRPRKADEVERELKRLENN